MAEDGERRQRRALPDGGSGSGLNPLVMWDEALEKLKVLDYEKSFCAEKGVPPFDHTYFAVAAPNSSSQLSMFVSIVTWLCAQVQHEFAVDRFDDPNTTTNKMMLSLKSLGFDTEFAASKLKQGNGEAVCSVLLFLCNLAMKERRFAWGVPSYPETETVEEAEVDEEADLGADIVDEAIESEEEEALYYEEPRGAPPSDLESSNQGVVDNTTDPVFLAAWRTELERVGPRLNVGLRAVGNEWRAHLQQTRLHEQTIKKAAPHTAKQLSVIGDDVKSVLERTAAKERHINNQFESLCAEYSVVQKKLKEISATFSSSSETVGGLTNDLQTVAETLKELKGDMDSRGNSMTDTSPLLRIRKALAKLKAEVKEMELRIGVVGHTLMASKLRSKNASQAGEGRSGIVGGGDDDSDEEGFTLEEDF